jgi:hypothetical protein
LLNFNQNLPGLASELFSLEIHKPRGSIGSPAKRLQEKRQRRLEVSQSATSAEHLAR